MTFAAVMLWIKTFLSSVPRSVYTHGLAFIVGVVLRGCLAVALVVLLADCVAAAPPPYPYKPCPVNGENCTCGCQQGGQCNCALTRVAPERLSRLDPQALAYRDLCEWAEKHPGWPVDVYVQQDPVPNRPYMADHYCRYDAGWPQIKTPTIIHAMCVDGLFQEVYRTPRVAFMRQYQPLQRFGGNCSSGNCRSR